MPAEYVDLIVDVPALLDRQFTYELPEGVRLPVGAKVRVPFGRGEADGFVVAGSVAPPGIAVKTVKAVYDLQFLPQDPLIRLAKAVSDHYCTPLSSGLACLWPPVVPRVKIDRALTIPKPIVASHVATPVEGSSTLMRGDRESRWRYYLRRIKEERDAGRGVLVLIPEIKGMDAALRTLHGAFPGEVLELHSELSGLSRRGAYLSLHRGDARIAVGTRAAVFAPVSDLGLCIIDEESSEAYRSPESPFYDARVVARMRGQIEGCEVLFGSMHPAVDTMQAVRIGQMREVAQEPCAPDSSVVCSTPTSARSIVTIVDLKGAKRGGAIMSSPLVESLNKTFGEGGRAILFLNRRGEFTQVTCRDCGNTLMCERCSVPLSYHSKDKRLLCHTCGREAAAPEECPNCGGRDWYFAGFGIERAEKEFRKLFPAVPLFRMEKESKKDEAPSLLTSRFGAASPGCLLTTSTVLRLSPMPKVELVGVLSCDTILNLPDYRASEKAFHLLTSLLEMVDLCSPRACFIAQTYNPENAGVKGIQDPKAFYDQEIEQRRILGYPPFKRFFKVHFHGKSQDRVREAAASYANVARSLPMDLQVLGPAPAPKAKARGEYWYQVAFKVGDGVLLCNLHKKAVQSLPSGVKVSLDSDSI